MPCRLLVIQPNHVDCYSTIQTSLLSVIVFDAAVQCDKIPPVSIHSSLVSNNKANVSTDCPPLLLILDITLLLYLTYWSFDSDMH